jgi:AraC-like DNA-binding protein
MTGALTGDKLAERGKSMDVAGIVRNLLPQPTDREAKELRVKDAAGDAYHVFPDGSRYFDDLALVVCQVTSETGRLSLIFSCLTNPTGGPAWLDYRDGTLTEFHKHNFMELAYVAEGELHQDISGNHEVFRQGEICIMGKNTLHAEYLYTKPSIVMFLGISNSFFDKTFHMSTGNSKTAQSVRTVIMEAQNNFRFIRFVPKTQDTQSTSLLAQILTEITQPGAGSVYLTIGYVDRLLNILPEEYESSIEKESALPKDKLFNDIQRYLDQNYEDISLSRLAEVFNHNADYLNRFIKKCTGMSYSHFLQHIRLEKALALLNNTDYTVEEIARQVGYENLSYFYRIFHKKYGKNPSEIRVGT